MERFKKLLRHAALVLMIILASLGIGLTGGAPIPSTSKREESPSVKIELMEKEEQNEADEAHISSEKLG